MNEYECVPVPLCLQEADRPTCERVEGPPKTASVMQLAEVVTKLDDPVLQDVLGDAAASRTRATRVARVLRLLLSAVQGTAPGTGAVPLTNGLLQQLRAVAAPLPRFPKERHNSATYLQFNLQMLDGHSTELFAELLQMQKRDAAAHLSEGVGLSCCNVTKLSFSRQ